MVEYHIKKMNIEHSSIETTRGRSTFKVTFEVYKEALPALVKLLSANE